MVRFRFPGSSDVLHPMVCQELVHGGLLPGGDAGQVVVHQEEVTEDVGVEALGAGRQEAIKVVDGVLPQALPHEPLQMLQAEGLTRLQHQPAINLHQFRKQVHSPGHVPVLNWGRGRGRTR